MLRLLLLGTWLLLFYPLSQVHGVSAGSHHHPGFEFLASASHYWPLEHVDGIRELWDTVQASRDHSLTAPLPRNVTLVCTNDSAYSNSSATVDIVEGKIDRGLYIRDEQQGVLRYYGSTTNSCISSPSHCGPEGVTFSFFWKTLGQPSKTTPWAYGGQVVSNGFMVAARGGRGSVELYTRENSMTWAATFSPPGPYWTHVLFTWKSTDGLKVYVNGTLSTSDPSGKPSHTYGDPSANLVIRAEQDPSRHYENSAFDEFVIWNKALSPDEVSKYFTATIGEDRASSSTPPSFFTTPTVSPARPTDAYYPIITNLTEERRNFQNPGIVLSYLQNVSLSLPNESLSWETAWNLTETFLNAVGEVLLLPSWTDVSEDQLAVLGLIDAIDTVMGHASANLRASERPLTIAGSSSVAEYSLARVLPKMWNGSHYRFPAQGLSYIQVPNTAFRSQAWTTIVGLLYGTLHLHLHDVHPASTRIAEAAKHKDCLMSAASPLVSLEVSPPLELSQTSSGPPPVTVHLTHTLTLKQYAEVANESNRVFWYCAFLDFSSGRGVWSDEGCALAEGTLTYSVCHCTHLTNFAILMQVVPLELPHGHQVALSAISYVGCSLSVVCLTATLATFAVLSSVSTIRNQRYHIHASLSLAVLVAQVLLLVSFQLQPGTTACRALAVLLHYFFLSAFAWMLVEGLHLYSMVVKVFGSEHSKRRYYCGIGWGFPLLICGISLSSAVDSYGASDNCWLSLGSGAIWAFVAPALLVIMVNVSVLIAVTRVISRISADSCKIHGDPNAFRLTMKAVAVLLPLLGTSWVFGVLAVNDQAVVFQYVFAVLNSLQGLFIFLFHCLLNSECLLWGSAAYDIAPHVKLHRGNTRQILVLMLVEVRAAFKHKTKIWSLTGSSARSAHMKPCSSDIMNGVRPATASSKLSPWDKSSLSAHRVDLSAV